MNVVIRQLCHRFHDDWKLLHSWNIFDYIKFRPSNSDVTKEMQEQIVPSPYAMNIRNRRILRARIRRHHHVAFLIRENDLPRDIALDYLVREVPPHRVTTERVDLKALLQCKATSFKADVHESSAREVGVRENSSHPKEFKLQIFALGDRFADEFAPCGGLDSLKSLRCRRLCYSKAGKTNALQVVEGGVVIVGTSSRIN